MSERAPVSPCVSVCTLDPATGLCRGCLRTIEEIAQWPRLPPDEKRRVLAAVTERRLGEQSSHGPHARGEA